MGRSGEKRANGERCGTDRPGPHHHDTYGSYSFGGDTAQGYIVGAGRLTVQSGQLLSDMGQRTVVLTFCLRNREKVLAAYVFGKDGNLYYMELTQMK